MIGNWFSQLNKRQPLKVWFVVLTFVLALGNAFGMNAETIWADGCQANFNQSPSSPVNVGTVVHLHGDGGNCVHTVFTINGSYKNEGTGSKTSDMDWHTDENGPGSYTICFLASSGGWDSAAQSCTTFQVTGPQSQPTSPPSQCQANFSQSPSSPVSVGTIVHLHGDGGNCVHTVFTINGSYKNEGTGSTTNDMDWHTDENGPGAYSICFFASSGGWDSAARSCTDFQINGSQPPPSGGSGGSQCQANFSQSPSSPVSVGTIVHLHGDGGNCVHTVFTINGSYKNEGTGSTTSDMDWHTDENGAGTYTICFLASNGGWDSAARSCTDFQINGGSASNSSSADSSGGNNAGSANTTPNGDCSAAPGANVSVGTHARVTYTDGSPTRLRQEPSRQGTVITKVPEGEEFDIIDGPVCNQGWRWWKVSTAYGTGWMTNGDGGTYWIEPYSHPSTEGNSNNNVASSNNGSSSSNSDQTQSDDASTDNNQGSPPSDTENSSASSTTQGLGRNCTLSPDDPSQVICTAIGVRDGGQHINCSWERSELLPSCNLLHLFSNDHRIGIFEVPADFLKKASKIKVTLDMGNDTVLTGKEICSEAQQEFDQFNPQLEIDKPLLKANPGFELRQGCVSGGLLGIGKWGSSYNKQGEIAANWKLTYTIKTE